MDHIVILQPDEASGSAVGHMKVVVSSLRVPYPITLELKDCSPDGRVVSEGITTEEALALARALIATVVHIRKELADG